MEGITLGILIGAGTVALLRNGRDRARGAIGWAARQTGWIAGRIQSDLRAASHLARQEFERQRQGNLSGSADAGTASKPPSIAPQAAKGNGKPLHP